MTFQIDGDLKPELLGLAWMIGHWEGTANGRILSPDGGEFSCTIDFSENGGAYLHYVMQAFLTDDQGVPVRGLTMETGFWRPAPDGSVEVIIAHPEGVAEVYFGSIEGAKIELTTDAVARTLTAEIAQTGGHRLYGNVESDLLFAYDLGTADEELQPWIWARLRRR